MRKKTRNSLHVIVDYALSLLNTTVIMPQRQRHCSPLIDGDINSCLFCCCNRAEAAARNLQLEKLPLWTGAYMEKNKEREPFHLPGLYKTGERGSLSRKLLRKIKKDARRTVQVQQRQLQLPTSLVSLTHTSSQPHLNRI